MKKNNKFLRVVSLLWLTILLNVPVLSWAQTEQTKRETVETTRSEFPGMTVEDAIERDIETTNSTKEELPPFCRHEFSVWGAGGLSALNYKAAFGDREMKTGVAFGVGYTYYFNRWLGLLGGVELAWYNTDYNLSNLHDAYWTQDLDNITPGRENEDIIFHTDMKRYKEKQRMMNLNVPIALQFQTPAANNSHKFFASVGVKLGFPLQAKYEVTEESFKTYGEYAHGITGTNQTLYQQADLGYGTWEGNAEKEKLDFRKLAVIGTAEAGVKWRLSQSFSLYTGAYLDYGFNDISKRHNDNLVVIDRANAPEEFTSNRDFSTNSVLTSQYSYDGAESHKFAKRVYPFAVGLKIRLGINLCKSEKADKTKAREVWDSEKDPYRKGYRDGFNDNKDYSPEQMAQLISALLAENGTTNKPGDPLWEAEMQRAVAEYGVLEDLLVLYVDGYGIDQTELSTDMKRMIDEKILLLEKYNNNKYIIICEGHTCDLGSESYNMQLGKKRAEVVKKYLVENGFSRSNLITSSKGEEAPVLPNTDEFNRKYNRRVVFLIKNKR